MAIQQKFVPVFKEVMATNNEQIIRECIAYVPPMSICQFLFNHIYYINNELGYIPNDNKVDLTRLDSFIDECKIQYNILKNTK